MKFSLSDESELEKLFKAYQQSLMSYLLTRVHNWHQAEDLCQETFLKARIAIARDDLCVPTDAEDARKWLFTIASNTATDLYRRQQRLQKRLEFRSLLDNSKVAIEGHAEGIIERIQLYEALTALPPKERKHLWLQYHLGYKAKEIAAAEKISEKAVNANVSRAKTKLREKIYPVTIDLQRAQALNAQQVMLSILEGIRGVVNSDKLDEYTERALDWHYRQYMKKHSNELRGDLLLNDPTIQALYADQAKRYGKDCWRQLLMTENKESPFYDCGTFQKRGPLYRIIMAG